MPATKKSSSSINLLPGKEVDNSTTGQVIRWLLSTFRIIVVAVQIVVIAAFCVRVFLDARLSSLNKEIEGKYALLESFEDVEDRFREVQLKLNTYKLLNSPENSYLRYIDSVAQSIPVSVQLVSVEKAGSMLTITARTPEESAMYLFSSEIEKIEGVENAQVVEIREDTTTDNFSEFIIQAIVPTLTQLPT